jgi:molybdate transport system substrate-binding protein
MVLRWLLLIGLLLCGGQVRADPIRVFAAASLTDALTDVAAAYTAKTGQEVTFSFASSATAARQIEQGAKADLFVSADEDWMDYLAQRNLIQLRTRKVIAGNRLVLIVPATSRQRPVALTRRLALAEMLGADGRLVMADPASVPAGRYGQQALTALKLWPIAEPRLARTENVRAALMFIARGEAPLGIVYATDAAAEPKVRQIGVLPAASHAPIRYPAALTVSAGPTAAGFLNFLASRDGQKLLRARGFLPPR